MEEEELGHSGDQGGKVWVGEGCYMGEVELKRLHL